MKAMTNAELKETVSAWLATQRAPAEQELVDEIDRLQRGLLELQVAFDQIYTFLAKHPERNAQAQPLLAHLIGERQLKLTRLAERMLEWRLTGGSIELRPGGGLGENATVARVAVLRGEGDEGDTQSADGEGHHEGPPPVSAEVLLAWQQRMKQARTSVPVSRPQERIVPEERQRSILRQLMVVVGEPRDLSSTVGTIDEVDALEAITAPDTMSQWALLAKPLQRSWLSVLVTRTRALKDVPSLSPGLREKIKVIILNFPAFAKQQQPGYVNGLQVAHQPEHGSWLSDSVFAWAQLKDLAREPEPALVVEPPPHSSSKRVLPIDDSEEDEDEDEDEALPPVIEANWPLWSRVRGKRVVLLGGEPREQARLKLEDTFDFAELEWVPADNPRRLDSLVERVHLEKVDLVLVLQNWIAHKVSNKLIDACKNSHVPWALVGGYGVKSVRSGLDRFLSNEEGRLLCPHRSRSSP